MIHWWLNLLGSMELGHALQVLTMVVSLVNARRARRVARPDRGLVMHGQEKRRLNFDVRWTPDELLLELEISF